MWQPGTQADAHEVLIGILNSAGVPSSINDLIQFEMVTTGIARLVKRCMLLRTYYSKLNVQNVMEFLQQQQKVTT